MVENLLKERYELAAERVRGIEQEKNVPERFQDYFEKTGKFLVQMLRSERADCTGRAGTYAFGRAAGAESQLVWGYPAGKL